jgi:hypothetical protein
MKDKAALSLARGLFDAKFYARAYPDACRGITDLAEDYFAVGWREGRNPSANFDTRYYLEKNPAVRKSGECPLIHYARKGAAQGLLPSPKPSGARKEAAKPSNRTTKIAVDPVRATINKAVSPRQRARDWANHPIQPTANGVAVSNALAGLTADRHEGYILAFSHDDYVKVDGGIQNCVGDEEAEFRRAGWAYIHICPARPLPMLSDETSASDFLVSVRVQRELIGVLSLEDLVREVTQVRHQAKRLHLVVHHLLGFSPELITEAATRLLPDDIIFWVHDFFTLCSNYALLRNDVEFCHAPGVASPVCSICCYGSERQRHTSRIKKAFETLLPTVLAPSETALTFWKEHHDMPFKAATVVPHGELIFDQTATVRAHQPMRVGFLGAPFYNKGWHTFEALAAKYSDDNRYQFFHLGVSQVDTPHNIEFIGVSIKEQGRKAMTEAVAALKLDAVVNWSLCYETFSFTTHEAIAGGAFVIARKGAGNIWPAVQRTGADRGCAIDNDEELFALFAGNELEKLTRQKRFAELALNAATATYLLRGISNG